MKVVSKLLNEKKFWAASFCLQATKFVVWDVVQASRPRSDCADSQNGSVSATM